MIGQLLGQYRITARLGEGGMGEVYLANDEMLDREVALKMLRPELAHRKEIAERFRAEAVTLARLDHPNIARLHGMSKEAGHLFMVMEFVPGETLFERVARQGGLPWRDAVALSAQALDALHYAHAHHVVHRDVKPANLIARPDGRVKVTDFGIARVLGSARATRAGHIVGTLEYMAPEQIRGEEVDGRADLYAAGIVLYELLTGRVPFSATTEYELMRMQLEAPVQPVAGDVPAWCDAVLTRALAKSPADRYQSAEEFRDDLAAHAAREPQYTSKPTRFARPAAAVTRVAAQTEPAAGPTRIASMSSAESGFVNLTAAPSTRWSSRQMIMTGAAALLLTTGLLTWRAVNPRAASRSADAARTDVPTQETMVSSDREPAAPTPLRPAAPRTVAPPPAVPPAAVPQKPRLAPEPAMPVPPVLEHPAPPVSAPVVPAVPPVVERSVPKTPAISRPAAEFEHEAMVVINGKKSDERDIVVRLLDTRLELVDRKSKTIIQTVPYARIESATYSRSKSPRWKTASAGVLLGGVFASPLFFLNGTKHWLTLEGEGEPLVLRLDKNSWERLLPELELRSGFVVAREIEKKS